MTNQRSVLSGLGAMVAAVLGMTCGTATAGTCEEWTVTPNPVFEGAEFRPSLIAAFAPDSAVAVSSASGGLLRTSWDGSAWTAGSPEALPFDEAWNPRAVAGSAPDDLWVCGLLAVDAFHGVPFLARFDGQEWDAAAGSLLEDPNPEAGDPIRSGEGSSIVGFAPDDIWVVGNGDSPNGSSSSPVTFHWDGSNLEEYVPQIEPVYGRVNNTEAVAAAASDAMWLVGSGRNVGSTFHLFIYHFDGSTWNPQLGWTALPDQEIVQDQLYDVVAFAHDDAWAVGKKLLLIDGTTHSVSMYLHWDGSSWTEIAGPDIGPITSAAASGPNDIWASNAFGEYGGRLAHWDGTTWTELNSAPIPDATHIGLTNLSASPAEDAWAVGYWAIYDGAGGWEAYENILEHFTPACAVDVDGDGDVDLDDHAMFMECLMGPEEGVLPGCESTDLDLDSDTDEADFAVFMAEFIG